MVALRMAALLEVSGISKSFPGVRALHEVGFSVDRGEVVALLGENGAGKSTLMKILAGVQPADRGEISIDGKMVKVSSVEEGLAQGIALIHQELNLATNLSVVGCNWAGSMSIRDRSSKNILERVKNWKFVTVLKVLNPSWRRLRIVARTSRRSWWNVLPTRSLKVVI